MEQGEFSNIYCSHPKNFAWFLGAGTSRMSGLRTASDIIWDLKRRYYCSEENQEITRQDIQNPAVREKIQSYMDSRGFPKLWADNEYTSYFEKIFGKDHERQRKYIKAILSEEHVALSVGNRVLGALLSNGLCRVVFTTNFDSVVEKAVAEVGGKSLSAFHLEGSHAANNALNNEEFPLYCKLHGDFRYDSLKNLSADLAQQNNELSNCMVNAGSRSGFIVVGYSGRDKSIMELFCRILENPNPFPHGLFWTGIKGSPVNTAVKELLNHANTKGVNAQYIEIETFDALMLRLWRNIENKSDRLDAKVKKSKLTSVDIILPPPGRTKPIIRLNALPLLSVPGECLSLTFKKPKDWDELRQISRNSENTLIFTKSDAVWCWGTEETVRNAFGDNLKSIAVRKLPTDIREAQNLHVKRFLEEALCFALMRNKPLLTRNHRTSAYLISDPNADDLSNLDPLVQIVGETSGIIPGLFTTVTPFHPKSEQVSWAEALCLSIDQKNGQLWVLLEPNIWVWPPRERKNASVFLDQRRADRFNRKHNNILDAWVRIILGTDTRNTEITLSAFEEGNNSENPHFSIGSRTAFARRITL